MCSTGPEVSNPEKIDNFKASSIDKTEKPFGGDIRFVVLELGKHALYAYKFVSRTFGANSLL